MSPATPFPEFERFEIVERVGAGAFADVYKAHDRKHSRIVALKVISPHLATDPVSLERFRREVQITRHIGHPSVVPIFEVYEESNRPVLVMEYVEGEELKQFVTTQYPIPFDVIASILRQILEALKSCHEQDVIHRDLKPQNILVTEDHQIRVLDFGVARMMQLTDLTKSGTTLGTPEYAAPEVYSSSLYDPRSDLYSIGVIGFELVSGQLPFQANSVAELFHQQLNAEPRPLATLRPDTPDWLVRFIARLMARQPFERYQSCEEALRDLKQREVVVDSEFALPQRTCLQCRQRSPEALSICLHCGYDSASPEGSAVYDLVYPKGSSKEGLREFVQRGFNREISPPNKTRVLIAGLSEAQANALRDQAGKSGLSLETRKLNPALQILSRIVPAVLVGFLLTWILSGGLTLILRSFVSGPLSSTFWFPLVVNTSVFVLSGVCLTAFGLSLFTEDPTVHESTTRESGRKAIAWLADAPGFRRLLRLSTGRCFALLLGLVFVLNALIYGIVLPPPLHQGILFFPATALCLLGECLAAFSCGLHIHVKHRRLRERLHVIAERRRDTVRRWCGPVLDRMHWIFTGLFIVIASFVWLCIAVVIHKETFAPFALGMFPVLFLECVLVHRAFRSLDPPLLPRLWAKSTRLLRISQLIRPYVRATYEPEFRSVLIAIVHKLVAVDRVLEEERAGDDLENIAFLAARVTHEASKVRQIAPNHEVHQALTMFHHLAHRASRSDDRDLLERKSALQQQLAEYMRIEEGVSRLYLQLIRINASVDRLTLMELRTRTEVKRAICGGLAASLKRTESEMQIFLETKSELEQVGIHELQGA